MHPKGMFPATFIGGSDGAWRIHRVTTVTGEGLAPAERLDIREGLQPGPSGAWALRGVAGHVRYVERREKDALDRVSPPLARPEATRAALIPIRKSPAWWALTQDERRAVLEERSRHIADS